jgi:hypothetical protein
MPRKLFVVAAALLLSACGSVGSVGSVGSAVPAGPLMTVTVFRDCLPGYVCERFQNNSSQPVTLKIRNISVTIPVGKYSDVNVPADAIP